MNEDGQPVSRGAVLIVDDTPRNIQVLANMLSARGHRVIAATNGQQALESVEKTRPDLILLDVMMPVMDGYETCSRLKAREGTRDIPVIFLTAKDGTEDLVRGFTLGAVDYVRKPFSQEELFARVETHLEVARARRMAEKSLQEKRELVHVLCHDLSNPLGFILNVADMANETPAIWEEMRPDIAKALRNGADLIKLVRTMSALDEGKLSPALTSCSLASLVEEAVGILQCSLKGKEVRVELELGELRVMVERTSFVNSVFNNLLTNALKFSPRGGVIRIRGEAQGDRVRFSVRDFGVGMPEDLRTHIFDPRKSTTRPGTEGERGTGYGMLLVKKFVESYGGTIELHSQERSEAPSDHGTEVTLTLKAG